MEKFYEDHIPKSCLPSDFGGDLQSVEELHQASIKEFSQNKKFFVEECTEREALVKANNNNNSIPDTTDRIRRLEID